MTIQDDLKCVSCRYNLRGLDESTACPECGQPVTVTLNRLERKRIRFANTFFFCMAAFILYSIGIAAAAILGGDHGDLLLQVLVLPMTKVFFGGGLAVSGGPSQSELTMLAIAGAVLYPAIGAVFGFGVDSWLRGLRVHRR